MLFEAWCAAYTQCPPSNKLVLLPETGMRAGPLLTEVCVGWGGLGGRSMQCKLCLVHVMLH